MRLKPPEDAPLGQYMVTMSVSIATDGHVSDAQITEGAGAPFDDVARKAMAEFEFCPGRDRDDLAVACRITYRYVFVR